jgi:ferrous iron transport protein B
MSPSTSTRAPATGDRTVVLIGRPNAGKSSVFNALTGRSARVGNYPGVTVDVLEGVAHGRDGATFTVVDLPGLYSLETAVQADSDEGVARAFIERLARTDARPPLILQVLDPTRLTLGLKLTREVLALGLPVALVLTQKDVLADEGRQVDVEALEAAVGAPVVIVDARSGESAREAILGVVSRAGADAADPPPFDPVEVARAVVTDVRGSSRAGARERTRRIDALLLHPLIGPVLFLGIMTALFAAVFLVADPATNVMEALVTRGRELLLRALGKGLLSSFLSDGVLNGAGTVLAFMPQIVILTIALELLEATGYLARGAFLVDRVLGALGLSGRSFVPLLMGHACAVPAIGATRVIRDPRERLTAILVLPLTTCSARLPTYAVVIGAFFADKSALYKASIFVTLYFCGILSALVTSLVLRRTATKGTSLPLVMEMPAYRLPIAGAVAKRAWRTSTRFLRDVGTTIVLVASILWAALHVPVPGADARPDASAAEKSVAASLGRSVEPLTKLAGFDWRINVGLVGSFGQRELMVGTLGVIMGVEDADEEPRKLSAHLREAKKPDGTARYSTATGLALLAFFVLACQCMSTVAAIRRETRSWRWPAFVLAYTYSVGFGAAVLVYQIARAVGAG